MYKRGHVWNPNSLAGQRVRGRARRYVGGGRNRACESTVCGSQGPTRVSSINLAAYKHRLVSESHDTSSSLPFQVLRFTKQISLTSDPCLAMRTLPSHASKGARTQSSQMTLALTRTFPPPPALHCLSRQGGDTESPFTHIDRSEAMPPCVLPPPLSLLRGSCPPLRHGGCDCRCFPVAARASAAPGSAA